MDFFFTKTPFLPYYKFYYLQGEKVFLIDIGPFFNAESENEIRFSLSGHVFVLGRFEDLFLTKILKSTSHRNLT